MESEESASLFESGLSLLLYLLSLEAESKTTLAPCD